MLPSINYGDVMASMLDFLPELLLCVAVVLLLVLRLFKLFDRTHLGGIALLLTVAALAASIVPWLGAYGVRAPELRTYTTMFGDRQTGLLVYDYFTVFFRVFLYGFTALVIVLSLLTGIPDREDSADFYVLLIGAVIGMALMAMSIH